MTILFVGIADHDQDGFKIKASYSEDLEARDGFKQLAIERLSPLTEV
jgi:hypothetical protein